MLKIIFRVDASLQMGSGHVMRCLTLASELRECGHQLLFACRQHEGHLNRYIEQCGFDVSELPPESDSSPRHDTDPAHIAWLGCDWQQDAKKMEPILASFRPDWIVVDHYALDERWENRVRKDPMRLMVIDDLADRSHCCDLLLDQTLGIDQARYRPLVPISCLLLLGPEYALLRSEFVEYREASLKRRKQHKLESLLVTLGGVDVDNVTGDVLQQLQGCSLSGLKRITVVMGATAPWVEEVRHQAKTMPYPTEVLSNVGNMAELMNEADLAIGAAGSTSWERCCLGVPTLMKVLADNQRVIAQNLEAAGAARMIEAGSSSMQQALQELADHPELLRKMSQNAANSCNGQGVMLVTKQLEKMQ